MSITNRIRFNNVRGDIFGGVTAAIVSFPLAFIAILLIRGEGSIHGFLVLVFNGLR